MIKEHFMRLSKGFAWVNLQEVKFVRQGLGGISKATVPRTFHVLDKLEWNKWKVMVLLLNL